MADGRAAYQALLLHNMGGSEWDKIIEAADEETIVNRRVWDGKNARYMLKIIISVMRVSIPLRLLCLTWLSYGLH